MRTDWDKEGEGKGFNNELSSSEEGDASLGL